MQLVLAALEDPDCGRGSSTGFRDADFLAERISILILLQSPTAWPSQHWSSAEASAQWQMLLELSGHTIAEAEVGSSSTQRPLHTAP